MLLFPILFILFVCQLLVSPILLWGAVPARFHTELAVAYAVVLLLACALWLRAFLRERRAIEGDPVAGAHWRWPARMSAELFRRKLVTYLAMQGWHVASSAALRAGRIELLLRKERITLALLCIGPQPPKPGPADLRRLDQHSAAARASHTALVTPSACEPYMLDAVTDPALLLLRYTDLARLDEVIHAAGLRYAIEPR